MLDSTLRIRRSANIARRANPLGFDRCQSSPNVVDASIGRPLFPLAQRRIAYAF
jgi:hypothetical protein